MPLRLAPLTQADIPSLTTFNHASFTLGEDAFKRDIFFGPTSTSTPASIAETSRAFFESDIGSYPDEVWLKVADVHQDAQAKGDGNGNCGGEGEEGEEVMACACWAVFEEDPWSRDAEGEGVNRAVEAKWLDREGWEEYKAYVEEFMAVFDAKRRAMPELRGRGHLHLYLLFTSPAHLRRGAASQLIRWGTSKADALGLPCIVESTLYAHRAGVYHKHGFRDYGVWSINTTDEEGKCEEGEDQDGKVESRKCEGRKWEGLPETKLWVMYRPARGEVWEGPAEAAGERSVALKRTEGGRLAGVLR